MSNLNISKEFNDPVHGIITLPPICVKIIDTPQFQRLRHLKQLGATDSVYVGATHNRFAHSIGVCHLAGEVIKHLKRIQSELHITEEEEKCVILAALCHDLGHGPLSHKFEHIVHGLQTLQPGQEKWRHEKGSVDMLEHLNIENGIGLSETEIKRIGTFISGKCDDDEKLDKKEKNERLFLYQIVANKENGTDVDKWDYFARDCHYLGIKNSFDHKRIIQFMRVCTCQKDGEETRELCFQDKLLKNICAMFGQRLDIFNKACYHKTKDVIEQMYADAIIEYFKSTTCKDKYGTIENILADMKIYTRIDDRIIGDIARSTEDDLQKARDILKDIQGRKLYWRIGEILDSDRQKMEEPKTKNSKTENEDEDVDEDEAQDKELQEEPKTKNSKTENEDVDEDEAQDKEIKKKLQDHKELAEFCSKDKDNLVILHANYSYGMKEKNPLKHINFYRKEDHNRGFIFRNEELPHTLPSKFQVKDTLLYTRHTRHEQAGITDMKRVKLLVKQLLFKPAEPLTEENPSADFTKTQLGSLQKVFKDPVHGNMRLPDYCVKIIDTPVFQRLRHIKQLGMTDHVYPGATHTRFEHSLGVCHLAGVVINHLKENQPHLNISDHLQVKCIEIAGLCQDIGHTTLSHDFEEVAGKVEEGCQWKKRETSIKILCQHMDEFGLNEDELNLICDIIEGKPNRQNKQPHFIYQIVENTDNSIDVNKFDYLTRDSYYVGVGHSFNFERIIHYMRVFDNGSGRKEIRFRDKVWNELEAMFNAMLEFAEKVYEHRVVKVIGQMYADALCAYLKEDAESGSREFCKLSAIQDEDNIDKDNMEKFIKLDDRIFADVERREDEKAEEKQMMKRIQKRKLYTYIDKIEVEDIKKAEKLLMGNNTFTDHCGGKENLVIIRHEYDFEMKQVESTSGQFFYKKKRDADLESDGTTASTSTASTSTASTSTSTASAASEDDAYVLDSELMFPELPKRAEKKMITVYSKEEISKEDMKKMKKLMEKMNLTKMSQSTNITPDRRPKPHTPTLRKRKQNQAVKTPTSPKKSKNAIRKLDLKP